MDLPTFAVQLLNAVQYGLVLFLVASGLTLVFGILGVINLAHGAFYMLGAYVAYWLAAYTGSFWIALLGGSPSPSWPGCCSKPPSCARCTAATTWPRCC